ncbi:amino acid adenylation domain-containing protein [Nonomuraea sp. NPDC050404]|uniref:amino acid adenylation domain-containing protein n=1 Tax=Nonomuraea sp. NPDC050404 TaxID=3155783 RepID=UPI0033E47360
MDDIRNSSAALHHVRDLVLPSLFEAQVERDPLAIAVSGSQGEVSYGELNARANRLARHLVEGGAGPETVVAIALPRSLDLVLTVLAVTKAGAAYLPLDPAHPTARLTFMLQDTGATLIVTSCAMRQDFAGAPGARLVVLDDVHVSQATDGIADTDLTDDDRRAPLSPDHLAYVIYTSGSTGRPKGVAVTHRGIANLALCSRERLALHASSRVLQFASISADAAFWDLCMALLSGAALVVAPAERLLPGPPLARLITDERVTHVLLAPSVLAALPAGTLPDGVTLIAGGEACTEDLAARWAPHHTMVNAYGPTETTVCATISHPLSGSGTPPIGPPVHGTRCYVLDSELRPAATGTTGELYVSGPSLARGYLNHAALTAGRFVACPFDGPGQRMYRTGDLVRRNARGELEFMGRADGQLEVRGHRIEPGEVETVLAGHDDVAHAVVVAHGQRADVRRLVGYLLPHDGTALDTASVRRHASSLLPPLMVPDVLVGLDSLPLTPNGKADREALAARPLHRQTDASFTTPKDTLERRIADVWCQTLDVDRAGVHDNFFDSGGTSLLITQFIARLLRELHVPSRHSAQLLRTFMAAPTITTLANQLKMITADPAAASRPQDERQRVVPHFEAEARLDDDLIFPGRIFPGRTGGGYGAPRGVFLTGATGFLGAHLLQELLTQTDVPIYCLVRAADDSRAHERLHEAIAKYDIPVTPAETARFIAVAGDLKAPRFGLSPARYDQVADAVDVIHHSGAQINFLYPYAALKPVNVDGTREIIRLAARAHAQGVHYVSTQAVFSSEGLFGCRRVDETSLPGHPEHLFMGYPETKWVAESLLREAAQRGMPLSIYRPHDVTGHSRTGAWNTDGFLCSLIKTIVELGHAPDCRLPLDLTPVDLVARSIVALSLRRPAEGRAFHLNNPRYELLGKLVQQVNAAGFPVETLPLADWIELLEEHALRHPEAPIAPFVPLFTERWTDRDASVLELYLEDVMPTLECTTSWRQIRMSGGPSCPPVADLLPGYVRQLADSGFLSPLREKRFQDNDH